MPKLWSILMNESYEDYRDLEKPRRKTRRVTKKEFEDAQKQNREALDKFLKAYADRRKDTQ